MSELLGNDRVLCPDCQPIERVVRGVCKVVGPWLQLRERSYSGTGVDHAACPECGHAFFVSYKVDDVTRNEDFDEGSRAERDAEEAAYQAKLIIEKHSKLQRLANELGVKLPSSNTSERGDE